MGMSTNGPGDFFARNYRYFIVGGLFVVLVVLLIVFAIKGKDKKNEDPSEVSGNMVESAIEVPTDGYETDAYPAVNTLLENYCNAMAAGDADTMASLSNTMTDEERIRIQETAKFYDGFQNYVVYTKAGPIENSYLAIVGYDIKFKNIETLAPALTSVYVCTDASGTLYVNKEDPDEDTKAYFQALSVQDDVVELLSNVETKYAEALASDEALNTLMATLKDQINASVKEALAAAAAAAAPPPQPEETVSENTVSESNLVKATDTVNIRKSASTEADALGKAEIGQIFTKLEELENGWTRIQFNDDDAYIKTEYLQPAPADAAATDTQTETTAPQATNGKVKAKDTVNIREAADEKSAKLGTAYLGEEFDLIEKTGDWCKISYKGKTAYVKAEFVE